MSAEQNVTMITRTTARQMLGVSTSTLQRLEKEGKLTAHRPGKRDVRYPLAQVQALKTASTEKVIVAPKKAEATDG